MWGGASPTRKTILRTSFDSDHSILVTDFVQGLVDRFRAVAAAGCLELEEVGVDRVDIIGQLVVLRDVDDLPGRGTRSIRS